MLDSKWIRKFRFIISSPSVTWAMVVVFHFVSSAVATWPLLLWAPRWSFNQDMLLYSWIFGWDWHALISNPLKLFEANIFYPAHGSLASSDHRLGILIFWAIPWLLTHRQFLSDGIALYLVIAFTSISTHIWARHWTGDHISAALAAASVSLNPFRIYTHSPVHHVATMWAPLALLGMDRFLVEGGKRWWALMVAAFWLQFQVSLYHAYGILLVMAGYFPLALWLRPIKDAKRAWAGVILGCVVLFITLAPFVLPYLRGTSHLHSSGRELLRYSPRFPQDYLLCYENNWLWGLKLGMSEQAAIDHIPLWMGLSIPFFTLISLARAIRGRIWSAESRAALLMGMLVVFMFVMSMGPYLKWGNTVTRIPLPFLLFAKTAPGFGKMTYCYRFLFTGGVICAPLVGLGMAWALRKLGGASPNYKRRAAAVIFMGLLLAADIGCIPWEGPEIYFRDDPRPVTQWLANRRINGGILEMPFTNERFLNNTLYMVQSLHHFHPIANGYGSFFPPLFRRIKEISDSLPDRGALRKLAALGVRAYVLHLDMLDFAKWVKSGRIVDGKNEKVPPTNFPDSLGVSEATARAFSASPYLTEAARFPKDIVYEYSEPVEVTDVLNITIHQVKTGPPNSTFLSVRFIGDGERVWRNQSFLQEVKFTVSFRPMEAGLSAAGPFEFRLSLPLLILPEEPFINVFEIDRLLGAGAYRLEITSSDSRVRFSPVTINFTPLTGEPR